MQVTNPRTARIPTSLYCPNAKALGWSVSLAVSAPIMMDVQVKFPVRLPRLKAARDSESRCRPIMEAAWGKIKKVQNYDPTVGRAM